MQPASPAAAAPSTPPAAAQSTPPPAAVAEQAVARDAAADETQRASALAVPASRTEPQPGSTGKSTGEVAAVSVPAAQPEPARSVATPPAAAAVPLRTQSVTPQQQQPAPQVAPATPAAVSSPASAATAAKPIPPQTVATRTERQQSILVPGEKVEEEAVLRKVGLLWKQGGSWKSWKERWCVMASLELKYYDPKQVLNIGL